MAGPGPSLTSFVDSLIPCAAFELCEVIVKNGGKMELGKAVSQLSSNSRQTVYGFGGLVFIQRFPNLFQFTREGKSRTTVVVQATMPVKFCKRAGEKTGCRDSQCLQIHLCPHFIKGNCTFGGKCRRSHNLTDHHTMRVLHRFNLSQIHPNSLMEFLRRIVDETEMERTAAVLSVPDVCKFYNNEGGCGKGDNCPYLHVCKHFVDGDCKFGPKCKRDHNFKNRHNKEVLKEFNLADLNERRILGRLQARQPTRSVSLSSDADTDKSEIRKLPMDKKAEFIPEICSFYNSGRSCDKGKICTYLHVCKHFVDGDCKFGSNCKRHHSFSTGQNQEVLKNYDMDDLDEQQILDHLKGKRQKRTSSASSDSGISAPPKSPTKTTAAKEPEDEVCGYHLKGSCNYGNNCIRKHTDLPYLWQYQFVTKYSQLRGNTWNDFPDDVNAKIEGSYSRPQNEGYKVDISGDIYQITFTNEGNMKAKPVFASSSKFSCEWRGEGGGLYEGQPSLVFIRKTVCDGHSLGCCKSDY